MILFRADGNSHVGMGHVMRCLSIADEFKKTGESCLFVTADSGLINVIEARGHMNLALHSMYNHMDDELVAFKQVIDAGNIDAILVDSYYVTEQYLRILWQFCSCRNITLVYIDDVLAFPYPCDILLNYNIYAKENEYRELYKNNLLPVLMLGTKYTPQREEFQNIAKRAVNRTAKNILVSTGGADFEHIALKMIMEICTHPEWNQYHFHFVVGMMNLDKDKIDSFSEGKDNITVHKNVKKMSELMQSCDVAISAAGSTLYELCSTQTPTITYILADNQIAGAESFEDAGVLQCAGDVRDVGVSVLVVNLIRSAVLLCNDFGKRQEIAQKMKKVIDGQGARRVIEEVSKYKRGE
ncbi:MAG: UDP-2,4-diacetamido-2,4,6-trideoxy-beta-L-altropyranose hydrolase [Lachnospiraceae bacterium]|nr:UDP-2,4-diacetamido-2,4,6-trideoxy-beta-L-altropyranose hydrolase [Lachnospiraceae bacterium]